MRHIQRMIRTFGMLLCACATSTILLIAPQAQAQDAQEEINKQIAKLTSDAISARLAGAAVAAARGTAPAAPLPNNAWASYTYSRLKFDIPSFGTSTFNTDIGLLGYDRDVSPTTTVGVAINGAKTRHQSGNFYGLSPYLAYRFSERYFTILRLNYGRIDFDGGHGDSYGVGASLNAVHPVNEALLLKGEAGINYSYSKTRVSGFSSDSTDSFGWNLTGDASYLLGSEWSGVVGLSANGTNKSNSSSLSGNVGVEKIFGQDGAVSFKYETRLADDAPDGVDLKVHNFTLALRWRF